MYSISNDNLISKYLLLEKDEKRCEICCKRLRSDEEVIINLNNASSCVDSLCNSLSQLNGLDTNGDII